jgi:hypothetical protein
MVKNLFLNYFKYNIDEYVNDKKEEEKEEEEYFDIIPKKRKRKEKVNIV